MMIGWSELVYIYRPRLIVWWVVILWYIYRWMIRRDIGVYTVFGDILDDIVPARSMRRYMRHIYTLMMILLFFVTLAQPVWRDSSESVTKKGIDIAIVLDISRSMTAQDIAPDRLTAAKQTIQDFVSELEADRIGMVVFAGKPFTSVPLTFDYAFVQDVLDELTIDTIDQNARWLWGTAIWDALVMWAQLFEPIDDAQEDENDDPREQIAILLSDWAPTQGSLDPEIAAWYAVEQGVDIYTIGLGSSETTYIQTQTPFGIQAQEIPGVDADTLARIAEIGSGKYWNAESGDVLDQVFDELSWLTKTEITIEQVQIDKPLWRWFAGVLGMMMLGYIYSEY